MNNNQLRLQHEKIGGFFAEIMKCLGRPDGAHRHAAEIRGWLAKLKGVLTLHLATEDKHLYPLLLKDPNLKVARLTAYLSAEMGGLLLKFESYFEKWQSLGKIEDAPSEFTQETNRLFAALERRIQTEETELFPLLERKPDKL